MSAQEKIFCDRLPLLLCGLYFILLVLVALATPIAERVDLASFFWGADVIFNRGLSPYGAKTFSSLGINAYPIFHPPTMLMLFYFSTFITYTKLFILIKTLTVLCLTSCAQLLYAKSGLINKPASVRVIFWLVCIFFYPAYFCIAIGNIDAILLLFALWTMLLIERNRSLFISATLITLCIITKIYFLIFLPWLLVTQQYKLLSASVAGCILFSLLSLLCLPSGLWNEWWQLSLQQGGYGKDILGLVTDVRQNVSINGFWVRTLFESGITREAHWLRIFPYLNNGLVFLFSLYVLRQQGFGRSTSDWLGVFALLMLDICLLGNLVWGTHLLYTLPAILWAICAAVTAKGVRKHLLVATSFLLTINMPLTNILVDTGRVDFPYTLLQSLPLYIMLAAWGLLTEGLLKGKTAGDK